MKRIEPPALRLLLDIFPELRAEARQEQQEDEEDLKAILARKRRGDDDDDVSR